MSDISKGQGGPTSLARRQHDATNMNDCAVPLIPFWVRELGLIIGLFGVLIIGGLVADVGDRYGPGDGWALSGITLCGTFTLWWLGYSRRRDAGRAKKARALYQRLQMSNIDVMTGRQFEEYCAALLRALGYKNVKRTGDTTGARAVDIIATAPDGAAVAVECKRWKGSVGPGVVHRLLGAITSGYHKGRRGIVMTNARLTPGATSAAAESGIMVVDRQVLQQWASRAKGAVEQPRARPRGIRPAAKATIGVLCAAAILLIVILFQTPASRPAATKTDAPSPRSANSGPAAVVTSYFAAVSSHDWPKVWQIAGKNLGYGTYATYRGMITGYRLTAKDIVTALRVSGDSVTGRIFAYETTGAVQTYIFSYTVHGGVIVAGHQTLIRS